MRHLLFLLCLLSCSFTQAEDIDKFITKNIYKLSPSQFDEAKLGFRWSDSTKTKALNKKGLRFQGKELGESIAAFKKDKLQTISFSLYNRGDNGEMTDKKKFKAFSLKLKSLCTKSFGKKVKRTREGASRNTVYNWLGKYSKFQLIVSSSKRPFRGQYITLRLQKKGKKKELIKKKDLKSITKKKKNGDTYIEGVPMVDQGAKHYCVAASIARIAQFYGRDLPMHEVAKLADTSSSDGTSVNQAFRAMKDASSKLKMRFKTLKLKSDVIKNYSKATKKRVSSPYLQYLYQNTSGSDVLKTITKKSRGLKSYRKLIKKSIDAGKPIAWSMVCGVHNEKGSSGSIGGHMRILIGYNEKTDEVIYSDSWGMGHEFKKWTTQEAYSVTNGIYEVSPH